MTASEITFEAVNEGDELSERYTITPAVHAGFVATFGDESPIHVDEAYAKERGFEGRVMHGTILNGFVSHLVGMRFPGRRALLQSVDLQYVKPCFMGDELTLKIRVAQKIEALRTLVLHVDFRNDTRGTQAARGRIQVGIAP